MIESKWFPKERPRRFGHLKAPKLVTYRVAKSGYRLGLNRYPFSVIGASVTLGTRCISLTWGRPIKYGEIGTDSEQDRWGD